MRFITFIVLLAAFGAAIVYLNYGTIDPCGVLRQRLREEAMRSGNSFEGLIGSVVPDGLVNAMLEAQYKQPVTPGFCIRVLIGSLGQPSQSAP